MTDYTSDDEMNSDAYQPDPLPKTEKDELYPDQHVDDDRMMTSAYMGVLLQTALGVYQSPEKTTWTSEHVIDFLGKLQYLKYLN